MIFSEKTPFWRKIITPVILTMTNTIQFHMTPLLVKLGVRKRYKNPILDQLALVLYVGTGLPLTLLSIAISQIERNFLHPENYNHPIVSFISQDFFPKVFAASWMTGAAFLLLTNFTFFQGILLGASLLSLYQASFFLKRYIQKIKNESHPAHTLKVIADNLKIRQAKFTATARFFNIIKRLITLPNEPKLHFDSHSHHWKYIEWIASHYHHINQNFFIDTSSSLNTNLVYTFNTREEINGALVSSFISTVNFLDEKQKDDFALVNSIRWLHGTTSAVFAGMRQNALIPFGYLIQEFSPYSGELRNGIKENGINQHNLSGACPFNAEMIWHQYALPPFEASTLYALLHLNLYDFQGLTNLFDKQDKIKGSDYSEIMNHFIQIRRLQQWSPNSFKAWLTQKNNLNQTNRDILVQLKNHLDQLEKDDSFWEEKKNVFNKQINNIKDNYHKLNTILDDILNNKCITLTSTEKHLIISEFPILFASTKKHSPATHCGQMPELPWFSPDGLKLGDDIDLIITDTNYHKNEIERYLKDKGIDNITCLTYESFAKANVALPNLLAESFNERHYMMSDIEFEEAISKCNAQFLLYKSQPKNAETEVESLVSSMRQSFCKP